MCSETTATFPKGIIDSIYWIPLQSSDKNIIKEISKLCVTDSLILICDKYQGLVQAYSKEGNFEYQIKNKGNGPYEYLEIAAFTITPTSIYILDNYSNKISRYSIKTGRFIEKTTVPFVAWDMEAFDDNDFLFTYLSNNPEAHIDYKPIGFAVWRTNEHWEITHQYLPVDKDYTELYGILSDLNQLLNTFTDGTFRRNSKANRGFFSRHKQSYGMYQFYLF